MGVLLNGVAMSLKASDSSNRNIKLKKNLLSHLKKLKELEARLWGVTLKHLSNGEEQILEDTNHIIHMLNNNDKRYIADVFRDTSVKKLARDLESLKKDFLQLKKQIRDKNTLKNLISNYTIRLVEKENYSKLENIFLLEKQLYEVIDKQEHELNELLKDINSIKLQIKEDRDIFMEFLAEVRRILGGHMDHHSLWEEEKQGYSNTSNIIVSLIKEVETDIN